MIRTDGAPTIANAYERRVDPNDPTRKLSSAERETALLAEIARLRRALERRL